MNFYQNLIGALVCSHRANLVIAAAWQFNNGVRVLAVHPIDGESFLVDLPDTGWVIRNLKK